LTEEVRDFLNKPTPLWENELTTLLVLNRSHSIGKPGGKTINIRGAVLKIELPDASSRDFYDKHGLEAEAVTEITNQKIEYAVNTLALVQPITDFLNSIVKTVQIIKAEEEDTDISYSHPELPFSIFLSVCKDSSLRSTLRVAESLLHESMHLKLTLIENVMPLVKPFTGNVFFSPWRDEKRPARGVLHGLFVFRAILDYFEVIKDEPKIQQERGYIEKRISQIRTDLSQLEHFAICNDLTIDGATLTKNLLPSN
jgi:HEXXH motif-containing protein